MTTLEQRIAEAIKGERAYQAAAAFGVPDDAYDECAAIIARAVVAVLPTADVTDEQIEDLLFDVLDGVRARFSEEYLIEQTSAVRSLLTAQATAHAVEMDAMRARVAAVRALHYTADAGYDESCSECGHAWPCPTVVALGEDQPASMLRAPEFYADEPALPASDETGWRA